MIVCQRRSLVKRIFIVFYARENIHSNDKFPIDRCARLERHATFQKSTSNGLVRNFCVPLCAFAILIYFSHYGTAFFCVHWKSRLNFTAFFLRSISEVELFHCRISMMLNFNVFKNFIIFFRVVFEDNFIRRSYYVITILFLCNYRIIQKSIFRPQHKTQWVHFVSLHCAKFYSVTKRKISFDLLDYKQ